MKFSLFIKVVLLPPVCILSLSACTFSSVSSTTPVATTPSTISPSSDIAPEVNFIDLVRGKWTGTLKDGTTFTFVFSRDDDPLYLSCEERGFTGYHVTRNYKMSQHYFSFDLPYFASYETYKLRFNKQGQLLATRNPGIDKEILLLTKVSDVISIPEFSTNEVAHSYEIQVERLRDLGSYTPDKLDYSFSYELKNKEILKDFIAQYNLDDVTANKEDTELMISLLDWICLHCNHSSSGYPNNGDVTPSSLMAYYEETGGLNCRSLSLLLAQLLRAYGIPARIITCIPSTPLFQDCHVIVEAYSSRLNKWVMLDPTYNLILQNEADIYINVLELRTAILNNTPLTANINAAYNEGSFYLNDYLKYMAKNTALFIAPSHNAYGEDSRQNTPDILLVPSKFQEITPNDKLIITHDAEHFFASPQF